MKVQQELSETSHPPAGNDNNLALSSSHEPNKADDNEFVLLEVGGVLKAKSSGCPDAA